MSLSSDLNTDGLNDHEPNGGSSSSSNVSDYEMIPNPEFYGHPVQIVKVTDERKFELDVEALGNILLRDSIRDTPVVVVSIAGDFRKGMTYISIIIRLVRCTTKHFESVNCIMSLS